MEQFLKRLAPYLPSKKFAIVIGLCIIVTLAVIIGTSRFGSQTSFSKSGTAPVEATGTIGDIITRDSNKNGIPDWEESLWGFDPKGDGVENRRLIEEEKKKRGIPITPDTTTEKTESDIFVQDLLTTILALNQSGQLTNEAVSNLALTIGENIDAKRYPYETYTTKDLTVIGSTNADKQAYEAQLLEVITKYANKGLGNEFEIIGQGIENDQTSLSQLQPIAEGYIDFATELISIPTPRTASLYVVNLANASVRIGKALEQVQKIYSDVLVGMVGIDEFVKASDDFDTAEVRLREYFY